jgi:TPR repeat protein
MPTFQEVAQASGAPPISPFEPPEKHPDEDRELQEYIASFHYTPPAETEDELTMRSEVPVIDKEAPAEFHHASFDDDVPPPPEAGPHPTGEEYYPPAGSPARPRFLEISDAHHEPTGSVPTDQGGSTPSMLPLENAVQPSRSSFWMWSAIFGVLAIFGGLGFLEGRAQSTHAFRGPVEIAREEYSRLRERFAKPAEAPPVAAPESPAVDTAKQPQTEPKPESTEPPAAKPQLDTASETAQPATATATTPSQPAQTAPAGAPQSSPTPDRNSTDNAGAAKSEPQTTIEPPLAKPSSKVQPGQQELNKAVDASDPAAAAAWLWKSTSRGNPDAPIRLADMYIKGKGVPRSCEQALVLLRSAAIKENAPARNRLAALYANGTCVARDPVKAYQLMSSALAADPTSEWAQQNRQELWNQMTPAERAEAQKYR